MWSFDDLGSTFTVLKELAGKSLNEADGLAGEIEDFAAVQNSSQESKSAKQADCDKLYVECMKDPRTADDFFVGKLEVCIDQFDQCIGSSLKR